MSSQDQNFFNLFMVVIGVLVGIAVVLIVTARVVGSETQLAWVQADPDYAAAVDKRIAPVGRVSVAGEEPVAEPAAVAGQGADAAPAAEAPAAEAPAAEAPTAVAKALDGEQVYNAACVACHGSGVAGAPKVGDAGAWKARIATGTDTLNKHALEGFQGAGGFMPPKGGRTDLSDAEVMSAVDFMVSKSR